MGTTEERQRIEAFVADLPFRRRQRLYARTQLTPFEECALFGYENCPVSHSALARESSQRAGLLCEYFSRLSTGDLAGERFEYEVEYELDETDARGNPVTTTKLEAGSVEWPLIRTKHVDAHTAETISLRAWFQRRPLTQLFTPISWSQINRAREVAADFAEGKVVHGTLPEFNDEHVLVQREPLVLSEPAFEQKIKAVPYDLSDADLVDALLIEEAFIDRYNQRGSAISVGDVSYLEFLD